MFCYIPLKQRHGVANIAGAANNTMTALSFWSLFIYNSTFSNVSSLQFILVQQSITKCPQYDLTTCLSQQLKLVLQSSSKALVRLEKKRGGQDD